MSDWLSCRHPFGCQAPGEGCYGPCPVTEDEADEIQHRYADHTRREGRGGDEGER